MPPAEAGEAGEVAVECDEFALRFDGEGSEIRVGNESPSRSNANTQIGENLPMTWPRSHGKGIRPIAQKIAKLQRFGKRGGRLKDARQRNDAHETAEYEIREPVILRASNDCFEPLPKSTVVSGVVPMGVQQN